MLKLNRIERLRHNEPLFNGQTAGFNDAWWRMAPSTYRDLNSDRFSFWDEVEEVGRAEVLRNRRVDPEEYPEWPLARIVSEITFIEVRSDVRYRHYGSDIVSMLAGRYGSRPMVCHPMDSERFWERNGWVQQKSPNDLRHVPPLFVRV